MKNYIDNLEKQIVKTSKFYKMSPTFTMPNYFKKYSFTGPIPGIFLIFLVDKKCSITFPSFWRMNWLFGLRYSEAILANILFAPTPQLTVRPVF